MNRVVLITGSTRGIGLATAQEFLNAKDKVVIFCRHIEHVRQAFNSLRSVSKTEDVLATIGDVRQREDAERIVSETVDRFGKIDILVNNAGVALHELIENINEVKFDEVVETNLKGAFLFTRQVVPLMKAQHSGVIINVSSGLGVKGDYKYSVYSATKFALIGLGESVAAEVVGFGIKVYAVLPGGVNTKLFRDIYPDVNPGDLIQPEEVAKTILKAAEGGEEQGQRFQVFY